MRAFTARDDVLHIEDVPLTRIADSVGTPTYVYSSAHLRDQFDRLTEAFSGLDAQICYAVKANSNLSVLRLFHDLGAGFDIVSGGELQRVVSAGGDPGRTLFSGVGKSTEEIDLALKLGIGCFNVESSSELERIAERAVLLQRPAPISIRVNPNVDAQTHPYISTGLKENKFGVPPQQALELYRWAHDREHLSIVGIDCHIGSQITEIEPLRQSLISLLELTDQLADDGIQIHHVDVGGGMGVTYRDETEFDVAAYGAMLQELLGGRDIKLIVEPGRYLVANGGALLTRIEYLKPQPTPEHKNFAVVDAAMNDLLRPALYQAWHDVRVVSPQADVLSARWDIVGPICETGDFIAHDRELALTERQLLAIMSAGAYGMVQSSNYNTRSRPAEVLVDGSQFRVVRRRETTRDQLAPELDGALRDEPVSPER
ncbi:MAG: diaminopimelate decarboxylase [Pseudomonadales bacterium]|jgi:diaminopimelate decarboxylase